MKQARFRNTSSLRDLPRRSCRHCSKKEAGRRKLRECEAGFSRLANLAAQVDLDLPGSGCIGRIIAAVRSRSPEGYTGALDYARRLHAVKPLVTERDALTAQLVLVAPGWAEQVAYRVPPHNAGTLPGDIGMAWAWRQFHDTLQSAISSMPTYLQHTLTVPGKRCDRSLNG